jgi:hypothetical protein
MAKNTHHVNALHMTLSVISVKNITTGQPSAIVEVPIQHPEQGRGPGIGKIVCQIVNKTVKLPEEESGTNIKTFTQ